MCLFASPSLDGVRFSTLAAESRVIGRVGLIQSRSYGWTMVSDSGLGLWGPAGVVSRCGLRVLKKNPSIYQDRKMVSSILPNLIVRMAAWWALPRNGSVRVRVRHGAWEFIISTGRSQENERIGHPSFMRCDCVCVDQANAIVRLIKTTLSRRVVV